MIGIFGGTFDPVHNGHLHIATQLLNRLQLEQLQFMPCAQPVHRDRPQATAEQRCQMLEMVLSARAEFTLNTLELTRGGPSFTVDSLRQIAACNDASLLLLLGADAFNGFAQWKQPDEILRLAHLVVCLRPGIQVAPELYRERRLTTLAELESSRAGGVLLLELDAPDCSSSAVRAALATGETPRAWLAPEVAEYIEKHDLYRRSGD